MDPFLWNILKFTKKLKQFGEHLIREKDFWYKKIICPHVFLMCLKHIKKLLKHGEFSWKFCSCNFEIIRIYFILFYFFVDILCFHGDFSKLQKNSFKGLATLLSSFFLVSTPLDKLVIFFHKHQNNAYP